LTHHGIQAKAGDAPRPPTGGGPDPQLNGVGSRVGEGELAAIGTPDWRAQLRIRGRRNAHIGCIRKPLDGVRSAVWRQVRTVGANVDAQSRETQHGLRHLGDRRVAQGLHQNGVIARGIYGDQRRGRRIQNIQDLLRGLLVGQFGRHGQRGGQRKDCSDAEWHPDILR
jgi:hypothetical protein